MAKKYEFAMNLCSYDHHDIKWNISNQASEGWQKVFLVPIGFPLITDYIFLFDDIKRPIYLSLYIYTHIHEYIHIYVYI